MFPDAKLLKNMTADNEFQRWMTFSLNSLGIVVYLKRLFSSTNKAHKVL